MSIRLKMAVIGAALMVTAAMPAFAAASADDTVVATVNGDKVYKKDVLAAVKQLPVAQDKVDQVYPMVVDQIINEKLLDSATTKSDIENSAEYKKRLDVLETQLARQLYLENALKDKISDKAVAAEYEKFKSENKGKTEIHARHILVPTEEEAKQVVKELDGGAKFEDLASKRSSGPSAQNGGDLGYFTEADMIPEFSKVAFGLKKGEYTKTPVKTQFGWHVIKVEDIRTRKVPELKEVEGPIKNKLGQDALQQLVTDMRSKATIERFDMNGKPVAAGDAAAPAKTEKN